MQWINTQGSLVYEVWVYLRNLYYDIYEALQVNGQGYVLIKLY